MRVLFTTYPSQGHFTPLIPLARALGDAGHDVAVVAASAFGHMVQKEGFELLAAGVSDEEAFRGLVERSPEVPSLTGIERARRSIPGMFIGVCVPALLEARDRILGWRPDIVVREEGEFAAPILAALAGVPWVDHGWGPLRESWMVEASTRALEPHWKACGLDPAPDGGAYRWLYLDPCPPSLQSSRADAIDVRHQIRPSALQPTTDEKLPSWFTRLGDRNAVYVTLGTIVRFASDHDLIRMTLDALADRDVEVVVTVGHDGDPDAFGPQPANVHIERFVPQGAVLPHCAAAVTNAGAGSTLGALSAGVPLLTIPASAPSQPRNAQAVALARAGRKLERMDVTVEGLRAELGELLDDPTYRQAAGAIACEIDAMPAAADVVALVERLAVEREPLRHMSR